MGTIHTYRRDREAASRSMRYFFAVAGILAAPIAACAAPRTFSELTDLAVNLINGGIGVALILGIVIFFYGMVSNFHESKDSFSEKFRNQIVWGIIALFVMFSVWGILALLRNTLFGGGSGSFGGGGGGSGQALCTSVTDCVIE